MSSDSTCRLTYSNSWERRTETRKHVLLWINKPTQNERLYALSTDDLRKSGGIPRICFRLKNSGIYRQWSMEALALGRYKDYSKKGETCKFRAWGRNDYFQCRITTNETLKFSWMMSPIQWRNGRLNFSRQIQRSTSMKIDIYLIVAAHNGSFCPDGKKVKIYDGCSMMKSNSMCRLCNLLQSKRSQKKSMILSSRRDVAVKAKLRILRLWCRKNPRTNLSSPKIISVGKNFLCWRRTWLKTAFGEISCRKTISLSFKVNQYQKDYVVHEPLWSPISMCFGSGRSLCWSDSPLLFFREFDEFKKDAKTRDWRFEV